MKPSWNQAPDWAGYLAMNHDGAWHWHVLRPISHLEAGCWVSEVKGKIAAMPTSEGSDLNWIDTLECSPSSRANRRR